MGALPYARPAAPTPNRASGNSSGATAGSSDTKVNECITLVEDARPARPLAPGQRSLVENLRPAAMREERREALDQRGRMPKSSRE